MIYENNTKQPRLSDELFKNPNSEYRGTPFWARNCKLEKDELLPVIFKFVEERFAFDCSLSALSKATSYNYEYLSKYFRDRTGTTFTDYVNRFRINEACYIFQNSDYSILQTALDCGFDSLRSFNRNFKKILGITPSEYKLAYIS